MIAMDESRVPLLAISLLLVRGFRYGWQRQQLACTYSVMECAALLGGHIVPGRSGYDPL
jgi:hypothetical protein